jgi:hypothetical protein
MAYLSQASFMNQGSAQRRAATAGVEIWAGHKVAEVLSQWLASIDAGENS